MTSIATMVVLVACICATIGVAWCYRLQLVWYAARLATWIGACTGCTRGAVDSSAVLWHPDILASADAAALDATIGCGVHFERVSPAANIPKLAMIVLHAAAHPDTTATQRRAMARGVEHVSNLLYRNSLVFGKQACTIAMVKFMCQISFLITLAATSTQSDLPAWVSKGAATAITLTGVSAFALLIVQLFIALAAMDKPSVYGNLLWYAYDCGKALAPITGPRRGGIMRRCEAFCRPGASLSSADLRKDKKDVLDVLKFIDTQQQRQAGP
jgi:hypothetical protein